MLPTPHLKLVCDQAEISMKRNKTKQQQNQDWDVARCRVLAE